jgi:hypothetical protein
MNGGFMCAKATGYISGETGRSHNPVTTEAYISARMCLTMTPASPEQDMHPVNVSAVGPDRMPRLSAHIPELQELAGLVGWTCQLTGACQPQQQQVQHQAVELQMINMHPGLEDAQMGRCEPVRI